jgi:hypothetical protein
MYYPAVLVLDVMYQGNMCVVYGRVGRLVNVTNCLGTLIRHPTTKLKLDDEGELVA